MPLTAHELLDTISDEYRHYNQAHVKGVKGRPSFSCSTQTQKCLEATSDVKLLSLIQQLDQREYNTDQALHLSLLLDHLDTKESMLAALVLIRRIPVYTDLYYVPMTLIFYKKGIRTEDFLIIREYASNSKEKINDIDAHLQIFREGFHMGSGPTSDNTRLHEL